RDNRLGGGVLVFRDMTERKRALEAEARLIRSEAARAEAEDSQERLRALVQNASDLIVILGADSRITYTSPAAEQQWGYAPGALVSTRFGHLVHVDDRSAVGGALSEARRQPGTNLHADVRLRHADGRWRDCEVIATNRLGQPGVDGVVL